MKDRRRTIPRVESLESMALMSGMAAALHHAGPAILDTQAPTTQFVALSGTTHGFYTEHQANPDTGAHFGVFTTGRLTPVGESVVFGSFQTPGFIANGTATGTLMVFSTRGMLTLKIDGFTRTPSPAANPVATPTFQLHYTITGGTGREHGATGSGTIDVTLTPQGSSSSMMNLHGRITLVFHPTPPPPGT